MKNTKISKMDQIIALNGKMNDSMGKKQYFNDFLEDINYDNELLQLNNIPMVVFKGQKVRIKMSNKN